MSTDSEARSILGACDLFVFDLDMTLVQTNWWYLQDCLNRVMKRCGSSYIINHREMVYFWVHCLRRDDYIRNVFRLEPADFYKYLQAEDVPLERVKNTRVIDGVKQNLHWLASEGRHTAVITSAPQSIAEAEIDLLDFDFDQVVSLSAHREFLGKPDPASLLWLIKHFYCQPHKTVYIGNALEDSYLAMNAGVHFMHYQHERQSLTLPQKPIAVFSDWRRCLLLEV